MVTRCAMRHGARSSPVSARACRCSSPARSGTSLVRRYPASMSPTVCAAFLRPTRWSLPVVEVVRRCRPWLGTLVEIEGDAAAVEAGFAAIAEVHTAMSFHAEDSDHACLRRAPVGTVVEVAATTVAVLRLAGEFHAATG